MTTDISCRSDLKSDHNKGSTNVKFEVVSRESSGSSSDVTHTTLVGGPVLSLIVKGLRKYRKKFNRILRMEEFLAQGKPLNKEQAQLLQSKSTISALIDELEKLRNRLAFAVAEEISLALQCHAISGKNGTCQDQDQEKASEEKEFEAHKELPINSRSNHNEGSANIKSEVVSSESSGSSSDVTHTPLVGRPVHSVINKRLRNYHKKFNRILQMEEFLAQGKPLNKEQAQLVQSKSTISALIDELEKLRNPLASAVSEEISLALQCHAISGKNGTCKDQDQEKASEEKEFKAHKEPPINPKSNHDGSTKDVMGTERGVPSQVDQQNEGIALPLRTNPKQTDEPYRKWKIRCKNYLDENSRLLHEMDVLELEFERRNLSSLLNAIRIFLLKRWPKISYDSDAGKKEEDPLIDQQNEEDQEEENFLIDQQNEEFLLSPWEAERLGISNNDKLEEVNWESCCRQLRASNKWVEEQLRVYKEEFDAVAKLELEFPEILGEKPADISELWTTITV